MIKKDTFFVTGGPVGRNSLSYVERQADADLYQALSERTFCYVLTPRQMGKSSLVVRAGARLKGDGVAVANVDLTIIGQAISPEQWYRSILRIVGEQLNLEQEVLEFWRGNPDEGALDRLMQALQKVVLAKLDGPVVIFIDEVDYVRSLPFPTGEFFAAIRALHNKRTTDEALERLTFCLLGVASLSDLIEGTQTTPYNIGEEIQVTDFNEQEAVPLIHGLGRGNETGVAILNRVLYWTGGHPYLTQRLCQEVADDPTVAQASDVDRISESLFLSNNARISDKNLVFVRDSILDSKADRVSLLDLYGRVHRQTYFIGKLGDSFSSGMARAYWFLRGYTQVRDDETNPLVTVLRLSGITRVVGDELAVRNRIYYSVFDRRWIGANMGDEEQRRQRAAFTRGALRIGAIAALILAVVSGLAIAAYKGRRDAETERAKTAVALVEAEKQRKIAQTQTKEAERQRALAQEQAERANELRAEADAARKSAEEGKSEAEKQRQIARTALKATDSALKEAQRRVQTIREYQDGVDQYFKKDPSKAIDHFTTAIKLYDEQLKLDHSATQIRADKSGKAITLTNTAAAYEERFVSPSLKKAEDLYKEAQQIYRGLNDQLGLAYTYLKLGQLLGPGPQSANRKEALDALRESQQIYEQSGNPRGAAQALTVIATSYLEGKSYGSLTYEEIKQAVEIYNEVLKYQTSDQAGEISTLQKIVQLFKRVRDSKNEVPWDEYHYYQTEMAKALERRGDLSEEAQVFLELINSSKEAGKEPEALEALKKLLGLYRNENAVSKTQATQYSRLVSVSVKLNDQQRAEVIKFLTEQLDQYRQENKPVEAVRMLTALGQVYYRAGDKKNALRYYDETVKAAADAGNSAELPVADLFMLIGQHYYSLGDTQKALELYKKAYASYEQDQNLSGQLISLQFTGELYYSRGTVPDKRLALESFLKVVALSFTRGQTVRRAVRSPLFYSGRAVNDIYKELGEEQQRNQFLLDLHKRFITSNGDPGEIRRVGFTDPLIDSAVFSLYIGDRNAFTRYATEAFLKPKAISMPNLGAVIPPIILAGGEDDAFKIFDMMISDNSANFDDLASDLDNITFGLSFLDDSRHLELMNKLYGRYKQYRDQNSLSAKSASGLSSVMSLFGERKRANEIYLSTPPEIETLSGFPDEP